MKKLNVTQMENLQGLAPGPMPNNFLCGMGKILAMAAFGEGGYIDADMLSAGYDMQTRYCGLQG